MILKRYLFRFRPPENGRGIDTRRLTCGAGEGGIAGFERVRGDVVEGGGLVDDLVNVVIRRRVEVLRIASV